MKLYSKTQLKLKENTFQKKDLTLKEFVVPDNQGYNDINGIADSLTNNGKANVVSNPNKNVINATVLSKDNKVTPDEVSSQIGDTINTAKKTNSDVNVTGIKIPNNAQKISQTSNDANSSLVAEGFIISKQAMTDFISKKL